MEQILAKYKDRLINISGRNRSLVMKRAFKKRAFDLTRIDQEGEDRMSQLVDHLMRQDEGLFTMIPDPYDKRQRQEKEAAKRFEEQLKNDLEALRSNITEDIEELEASIEAVRAAVADQRAAEMERIRAIFEAHLDSLERLKYLAREIDATEKESGKYELYIGHPFVEGTFLDGTFVRAPLLLFPVRIRKDKNGYCVENIAENDVQVNKVLVYACCKCNGIKLPQMDWQYPNPHEISEGLVAHVLKNLKAAGIAIAPSTAEHITAFPEYTNVTLPTYAIGELVLKQHLVLGQFPISNSIYNDYEELEGRELGSNLTGMLSIGSRYISEADTLDEDTKTESERISESDLFFVSTLDYSQERAVKRSANTEQLVIYGPPGTGKSETIVNIITDHLAKGQRVLMVSQKRASLDVVYNRLASIQERMVVIHDANKGKKEFYNKIRRSIDDAERSHVNSRENQVAELASTIDGRIEALQTSWLELQAPRAFGLSLGKMYGMTQEEPDRQSLEERILALRKNNPFREQTYGDLRAAMDRVLEGSSTKAYVDRQALLASHPWLRFVPTTVQRMDIRAAQQALEHEELASGLQRLHSWKTQQGYKVLTTRCTENGPRTMVDEIPAMAKTSAMDLHSELLNPLNDGRWWSPAYWLRYRANQRQEMENKNQFAAHVQHIEEELRTMARSITDLHYNLSDLKDVFGEQGFAEMFAAILQSNDTAEKLLADVHAALENAQTYAQLLQRMDGLADVEKRLLRYGYEAAYPETEQKVREAIEDTLEAIIALTIRDIESNFQGKFPILSQSDYAHEVKTIQRLMHEKQAAIPDIIRYTWLKKLQMTTASFRDFKRQANRKRRFLPVRTYVQRYTTDVLNLIPCWLMGPETVSDILPLQHGLFDVVIFDEASQMFIENAVPSIFRGRKTLVGGDDKQLRPSSQFLARYNEEDDDVEYDMDYAAAVEEESLLDLAKVTYDSVHLNHHYRSLYEELINFSNHAFYDGQLQVSPNVNSSQQAAIERIMVSGMWTDRRTNVEEAQSVVSLVKRLLSEREHNETIGIITFNVQQRDEIEDLLENTAQADVDFRAAYENERNRMDGDQDVSLFVKNIENVQGDERDIIIFSIGYAINSRGRLYVQFGSLSQDGGENRLNVAVTRAKRKVYVITSIEPEDLEVDNTKNPGPKYLKKYLQYARAVSEGRVQETKELLNSLVDSPNTGSTDVRFDSEFEEAVFKELEERCHHVRTQIGVSGYRIDLAVYDANQDRYVLGVECDRAACHTSRSARERDLHRQRYLESRGWKIHRICSRDWWRDRKGEIQRLESVLQRLSTPETLPPKSVSHKPAPKREPEDGTPSKPTLRVVKAPARTAPSIQAERKEEVKVVWYGDTVTIRDVDTDEMFTVTLESNYHNRHLMKDIEQELLNRAHGEEFEFAGHSYVVHEIDTPKTDVDGHRTP